MILCAASSRSAVASMMTGALPSPTPMRRLAGLVGSAHIDLAARDHHQIGPLHELASSASRVTGLGRICTRSAGSPIFSSSRAHAVDGRLGGRPCRRRRRDDDGIAALQRHHGLVDGRGRRIGRRRDGTHHANRLGVFDEPFLGNFLDHARRLDPEQVSQRPEGLALVLDDLALHLADPGHFDGYLRQPPRVVWLVDRPGQRGYGLIDAALAESIDFAGKFAHGTARLGDQRSDCIGLCVAAAHAPVALGCFDFRASATSCVLKLPTLAVLYRWADGRLSTNLVIGHFC